MTRNFTEMGPTTWIARAVRLAQSVRADFWSRPRSKHAQQAWSEQASLAPGPMPVSQLEDRRLLSASIQALVVPELATEGDTVEVSAEATAVGTLEFDWTITRDTTVIAEAYTRDFSFQPPAEGTYEVSLTVTDSADQGSQTATAQLRVQPQSELTGIRANAVVENGVAVLSGTITHVDSNSDYQLVIDWSDPNAPVNPQTIDLSVSQPGVMFDPRSGRFTVAHQFLDDAPSVTASDLYEVEVRLFEDGDLRDTATTSIQVFNVSPVLVGLQITNVNEDGTAVLRGRIIDPGSLDTFELNIFWQEPFAQQNFQRVDLSVPTPGVTFDPATREFTVEHRYLDDDPSGTSVQVNSVVVLVGDDDNGFFVGRVTGTVNNVPPMLADVTATSTTEGNRTTLSGRIVDPGALDTFTLRVTWGDGQQESFTYAAGTTEFSETHLYLDDPKGPLGDLVTIELTLTDDDLGEDSAAVAIEVANVRPTVSRLAATSILENGVTRLTGVISDPGRFDTHRLEIQWGDPRSPGDSQVIDLAVPTAGVTYNAMTGVFSIDHQYLDDPLGTAETEYDISVRVIDNDGDSSTATTTVEVQNAAPSLVGVTANSIFENEITTLRGRISDPGSLDTYTLTINWGDGTVQEFTTTPGASGIDFLNPPPGVTFDPSTLEFTIEHRYLDDGLSPAPSDNYEIRLTLVDDDADMVMDATLVTVTNLPPVIDPLGDVTVYEGDTVAIFTPTLDNQIGDARLPGRFTDPGTQDTHIGTIDWGDGSPLATMVIVPTMGGGEFRAQHTFADNGVYTVTVTITDDDSGQGVETFQVTVRNVDPVLTVPVGLEVDEGAPVSLIDLGVMISDPGFDNPLNFGNSGNGGEFEETFAVTMIDWGDGLQTTAIDVINRVSGGPGQPTTAQIQHDAHYYADNGHYTVTVTFSDDDGNAVQQQFCIVVNNVDPDVVRTNTDEFDEGSPVTLYEIGAQIEDPGFDNRLNKGNTSNGGEFKETFTVFRVDWGDGTVTSTVRDVYRVSGGPGQPTTAQFEIDSHTYADDGIYEISVYLKDDDGQQVIRTIDVRILNVNPSWQVLSPSELIDGPYSPGILADTGVIRGDGSVEIVLKFWDPGDDQFVIWIDWGDGTRSSMPAPSLDNPNDLQYFQEVSTSDIDMGAAEKGMLLTIRHVYGQDVIDPNNASAALRISAVVVDDEYTVTAPGQLLVPDNNFTREPGISGLATAMATPAGITGVAVAIDTTPEVPPLELPQLEEVVLSPEQQAALTLLLSGSSEEASGGDQAVVGEQFWKLVGLNPDDTEWISINLDDQWMTNLPALFEKLPDGHYLIFRVRSEDNWHRLALDFYLRDHKAIDISDDSDGGRDAPPPLLPPQDPPNAAQPEAGQPDAAELPASQAPPLASWSADVRKTHLLASATLAAAACLGGAAWREEIGKTLADSAPCDWRYLQALRRRPR